MSSPKAYFHKKIIRVILDIEADFEGKGRFASHLALCPSQSIQPLSAVRSEFIWSRALAITIISKTKMPTGSRKR